MADKKKKIQDDEIKGKNQVLNRAKKLCSGQEKCISDILKKLHDWDTDPNFHEFIIQELITGDFINESRYALAFANDKYKFSKWGKIKILYALKGKKISESNIKNALDSIDDSEYILLIEKEIRSKLKTIKDPDKFKCKAKLFRYAQAKGFESELSFKIINKLISD